MQANLTFLTLRTFRDTGGIQKVCRSLCRTLSDLDPAVYKLEVLSLYDDTNDLDERYLQVKNFKGFSNRKIPFLKYAVQAGSNTDVLLLSHVNLLPVAMLVKILHPAVKIVLICHGTEIWRPLAWYKRKFLQRHVVLWSVSRYTSLKVMQQHQIRKRQIHIIPNGLDPFFIVPSQLKKPESLLAKYNLKNNCIVFLSLARMTQHDQDKGYEQLIHLLPLLMEGKINFCYLIGGETDEHEKFRLQQLIRKYDLHHHVKMIGFIPEDELVPHYLLADLFILPSKKEGFGLVFIEAAACGCRIICGKDDGSCAAVLHGQLGKMIDANHRVEFHEAVLSSVNSCRRPGSAQMQQDLCLANFSYEIHHKHVHQLITHCLKS